VRIALENAVSVASTLLRTEAVMTELPEPEKEGRRPAEFEMWTVGGQMRSQH
jgi:chaperonin GroEL